jgi:heme exporter protein D
MQALASYFAMGGYAAFIWPAYAVAGLVMVAMLADTLRTLKMRERQLRSLQGPLTARRGRITER